jgi:hypothetical protein
MVFGILEGHYLLSGNPEMGEAVHRLYGPVISVASTVMGAGFWIFFANVLMTVKSLRQRHAA